MVWDGKVLDGNDQSAEDQDRYSGNRQVNECAFFGSGFALLIAFDLFVKAIKHS